MPTGADRVAARVAFLTGVDAVHDQLLDALARGLADGGERTVTVGYGTDTVPGDRVLTDPRVAPFWALPHAGLYTGGVVPPRPAGLSDVEWEAYARSAVVQPFGALRGSPEALVTLARAYLTGTRTVRVVERRDGNAWVTLIITRPAETPDPAGLEAAVNADDVVIAGGRVDLVVTDATTYGDLAGTTYGQLTTAGLTYGDLAEGETP